MSNRVQGQTSEQDGKRKRKYSPLETPIPPHLRARLQALAAVTGRSVADILESWITKETENLDEARREVADRIASSAIHADLSES